MRRMVEFLRPVTMPDDSTIRIVDTRDGERRIEMVEYGVMVLPVVTRSNAEAIGGGWRITVPWANVVALLEVA